LNPYKVKEYNILERREMAATIITVFFSILYLNDEISLIV